MSATDSTEFRVLLSTVAVVDLEATCELYGVSALPHPLGRSRPVGSMWLATRNVEPIEERLARGDLDGVRKWVEALVRADVCVQCRLTYRPADTVDRRVHALYGDEAGFVAVQRRNAEGVDMIDIYAVAPAACGTVVADTAGLIGAGSHWRIAVADSAHGLPSASDALDEYDDLGFLMPRAEPRGPAAVVLGGSDVVATGTVRAGDRFVQWVQIDGDGDYVFDPAETGYAEPLDTETLRGCVDALISDQLNRR
jgi:hypothetical protein